MSCTYNENYACTTRNTRRIFSYAFSFRIDPTTQVPHSAESINARTHIRSPGDVNWIFFRCSPLARRQTLLLRGVIAAQHPVCIHAKTVMLCTYTQYKRWQWRIFKIHYGCVRPVRNVINRRNRHLAESLTAERVTGNEGEECCTEKEREIERGKRVSEGVEGVIILCASRTG
jgi:hypothetical protein